MESLDKGSLRKIIDETVKKDLGVNNLSTTSFTTLHSFFVFLFYLVLSTWTHCLFWFSLQVAKNKNQMEALEHLKNYADRY